MKAGCLYIVVSVHTVSFYLAFLIPLLVYVPEECFWLDCKASCTVTKLKIYPRVDPVVLAASLFLVIFDSSGTLRRFVSLLPLWMSSAWEGFPSFPVRRSGFVFTFCWTKMHFDSTNIHFGNRCVSVLPSSHTITSWECLYSILTFSWMIFASRITCFPYTFLYRLVIF